MSRSLPDAALAPTPSLSGPGRVGHQFISTASFPWRSSTSGDMIHDSTINIVVQTKKVANAKVLVIEGEIKLDAQGHTHANRFQLDGYEIVATVLHGNRSETLKPHPTRCEFISPESTAEHAGPSSQTTTGSSLTLINPTASSFRQLQFTTSTCKTYLGASVVASKQSRLPHSRGTVWEHQVEDSAHKTQGRFLGTFIASYQDCEDEHGCSPDDPTTLSITVKACLVDKKSGASSKPLEQILSIDYSDWPDQMCPAWVDIYGYYDANTTGRELNVLESGELSGRVKPAGVTCNMSVVRKLGSGFRSRIITSKIVGMKDALSLMRRLLEL